MDNLNISGIYKIVNIVNGKFYIGSAVNIRKRKNLHFYKLRKNIHPTKHLQKTFNKYGGEKFLLELVELVEDRTKLIEREQYYLDTLKPYNREIGYNTNKIASSILGYKHTEQTKELLRKNVEKNIDVYRTPEHRKLMGELSKKLVYTEEYRKKLSVAAEKVIMSDATKAIIRHNMTGKNNHNYGKITPVSTRNKISKTLLSKNNKSYDNV